MSNAAQSSSLKRARSPSRHAVRAATETADDLGHRVGDAAADLGSAFRDTASKAYDAAGDFGHRAVQRVESQPMAAIVAAAAIGFISGLLFARR